MPTCHCEEYIHCGALLFLWLHLSPPLATGILDCHVVGLSDNVTHDLLAEAFVADGALCCGDLFCGIQSNILVHISGNGTVHHFHP